MARLTRPALFQRQASIRDSGWRDEIAATLALAWPLAAANLVQMGVYAVDVIFVARLGAEKLAASSLSVALFGLLMWSMTGLVGAAAPLIAAELGAGRHAVREVRRTMRMALWLCVISGLGVMVLCAFGERIMLLTGQDPHVSELAGRFLWILMWAAIPNIAAALLRTFVATLGRPRIATAVTVLALVVNSLGNYAFVFGHFGAPAMGLDGSALSSVITACAMFAAYVWVILTDRRFRRYHIFGNWWRTDWARFAEVLRVGLPITGTILAEAGLFSGAAFLMGRIGEMELAGHTVALQVAALAFQVPFGIGQAATIRVGFHYGAGDAQAIGRAGNAALVLGVGFMVLTALVMWFAPRAILHIYIDPDLPQNAAMARFAVQYMAVAALFQLFDGAQAVAAGALRGLQDTRVPMWIAIGGYWAPGLMTSIGLGFYTPLQGLGIWIGLAVGLVVVASLPLWRWRARERLGLLPALADGRLA
jgi:MATE family multidrug resistance protein